MLCARICTLHIVPTQYTIRFALNLPRYIAQCEAVMLGVEPNSVYLFRHHSTFHLRREYLYNVGEHHTDTPYVNINLYIHLTSPSVSSLLKSSHVCLFHSSICAFPKHVSVSYSQAQEQAHVLHRQVFYTLQHFH